MSKKSHELTEWLYGLASSFVTSKAWRDTTSDRLTHTVYVSKQEIYNEVVSQLQAENVEIKDPTGLKQACDNFFNTFKLELMNSSWDTVENPVDILDHSSGDIIDITIYPKIKNKSKVFKYVGARKQRAQKELNNYINSIYEANNKSELYLSSAGGRSILDITHQKGSSVVEQQIKNIYGIIQSSQKLSGKQLTELEKRFSVDMSATFKVDTVTVSLGSSSANRRQGATDEATLRREFLNQLDDFARDVIFVEGSDSIVVRKRKDLLQRVIKAFKGTRNLKIISQEDTKFKPAFKKAKTTVKPKINIGPTLRSKTAIPRLKKQFAKPRLNLAALIPQINANLLSSIIRNMGSPRLNNRTGRFAGSAKVTDIQQTAKGYPSIGYTYMKDPYQVYEKDRQRDPRTLIDKSVREVAAGLINQRFYTRRT